MNKSLFTNVVAAALLVTGLLTACGPLLSMGLYALSGALTNWLAVHMLFEKVPLLYGSGIIPNRFSEFKNAIKRLIMEQFFTEDNIQRFFHESTDANIEAINMEPLLDVIDYDKLFDGLISAIMSSSLGAMVSMVGGPEVFNAIRDDFKDKMRSVLAELGKEKKLQAALASQTSFFHPEKVMDKVASIVDKRLAELTPEMVKIIVQEMIKNSLGWLVVWGGVFGALIGLVVSVVF